MVSRTLCPVSNYYKVPKPALSSLGVSDERKVTTQVTQEEVIVSVSSASEANVSFSMSASIEDDFYIG